MQLQPGIFRIAADALAAAFGPHFGTLSSLEAVQALTVTVQSILAKEGELVVPMTCCLLYKELLGSNGEFEHC